MNRTQKRKVLATLIKAGRRDLAEKFISRAQRITAAVMAKMPANTELFHHQEFSAWDGKLASVAAPMYTQYGAEYDFDPIEVARKFVVNFVDNGKGKPLALSGAGSDWKDLVGRGFLSQGGNNFSVSRGPSRDYQPMVGTFLNAEVFWVRVKLGDLYPGEVRTLAQHLSKNGWHDVSEVPLAKTLWSKVFKAKTWDELYDKLDSDKTNALYNFAERWLHSGEDDVIPQFRRGVFATNKKADRFRYIVAGPDSRGAPKVK